MLIKKINKIDKPLAMLLKRKRERTLINVIKNKQGLSVQILTLFKRIIKEYYEQFNVHRFDDLGEMHQFFERQNLSKLTQEENNLNSTIAMIENQSISVITFQKQRSSESDGFTSKFLPVI